MCLIIDANRASLVFATPPSAEFKPIWDWLFDRDRDGALVNGGHLATELDRVTTAALGLRALAQAGRVHRFLKGPIEAESDSAVRSGLMASNDPHVLGLARVSGARVLCTEDDALMTDFKNLRLVPTPKGRVYRTAAHARVLKHCKGCPGYRVGRR